MAAVGQDLGGLHAAGAAADDHDLLYLSRGDVAGIAVLPAPAGVDRAAALVSLGTGGADVAEAVQAAHARGDILLLAPLALDHHAVVGYEALGHGDYVRLAALYDVLGHLQGGDAADDGDRQLVAQSFLERRGRLNVAALVDVVARHVVAEGAVVGEDERSGGDAEHVYVLGRLFEEGDALLDGSAAGDALVADDAHLYRDLALGHGVHGLQDLQGESPAVLGGAAVLVGALVPEGGEEAGEQVAVGEVGHDHVEAGLHAALRGLHVVIDDDVHLGAGDLVVESGVPVVFGDDGGDPCLDAVESGPLAGVDELRGEVAAVSVGLVRQKSHIRDVQVVGGGHAAVEVAAVLEVDGGGADGHEAAARLYLPAYEIQHLLADASGLDVAVVGDDRRELDPVLHPHGADLYRLVYVRILGE